MEVGCNVGEGRTFNLNFFCNMIVWYLWDGNWHNFFEIGLGTIVCWHGVPSLAWFRVQGIKQYRA